MAPRRSGPRLAKTSRLEDTRGSPSRPTLCYLAFAEFFRMGRTMRVVLHWYGAGVAHLFVVYGYQGSESDADQLALTDQLITSVLCEAMVCCSVQPTILVADLNADPSVVPLANGYLMEVGFDLEKLSRWAKGSRQLPLVSSNWMKARIHVGTLRQSALMRWLPPLLAASSQIAGSPHTSRSLTEFSLSVWDAKVDVARCVPS